MPFTYDKLVGLVENLAGYALLFGGLIAIVMIIFYGLKMVLSKGDPAKFTEAKNMLIKAVIGALLIFGAYSVVLTIESAAHTLTQ